MRVILISGLLFCGCTAGYLPAGDGGVSVGDGATSPDGGANNDGSPSCATSGVDHSTCYPTADVGTSPRKAGLAGQRIQNFAFDGRPTSMGVRLKAPGTDTVVQLSDFFDPAAAKYAMLWISVVTRWSGPCNQMASAMVPIATASIAKKVVFLQAVTEGLDYKPATSDDLDGWIGDYLIDFPLVKDPGGATLGVFQPAQSAVPLNIVIDPRSMEIVSVSTGAPPDLPTWIDARLAQITSGPVKP